MKNYKLLTIITFLSIPLFSKEILRYKYFAESLSLDGSCGKIYSINSWTAKKNKVLFGIHRFDVVINYGVLENTEVGIKFNLNEQRDLSRIEKNIELVSPYAKYHIIDSCKDEPIDISLGFYKTSGFIVIEKIMPEFFSTSLLVNLFLSFGEKQKFFYKYSISKYTKWVEFMVDINPYEECFSAGARTLLTPEVSLDLFFVDLKNISNLLFYNFVFGVSIKI